MPTWAIALLAIIGYLGIGAVVAIVLMKRHEFGSNDAMFLMLMWPLLVAMTVAYIPFHALQEFFRKVEENIKKRGEPK